ncbi:MAG: tetratricopeptide repeat protein [Thermoflexales bacterium]|nr:tetratricopeptide repeat protein [Thermoflexales bacterium]
MTFEAILTILGAAAVALLVGFIPATYLNQALEGTVMGWRRREVRQLGLPEIFQPATRLMPRPWTFILPLVLVVLAVSVGILLVALLWVGASIGQSPADLPAWMSLVTQAEGWLRTVFFGFVGAYLFSIEVVTRRYREGDLDPQVYFAVAERIIVALLVAGTLGLTYPAFAAEGLASDVLESAVYIIAFTVGVFPESGLQWLTSLGRQWLRPKESPAPGGRRDYELGCLPGLNLWQAFRLNLAGIDNIPDLANADIQQLLRQTRFGIQQLYDWIDQAILYIHVTDPVWDKCQQLSVRSLTDFQSVYADPARHPVLVQHLGLDEGQLAVLSQSMAQTANGDQVQLFWKYNAARATGVIRSYNLGQAYFELREYEKAIDNLNKALENASSDPQLYATRGDVWRQKGELRKAIEDYDQSLRLNPQAPEVLHYRGLACLGLGQLPQAVKDFSQALKLDERNHLIWNERGLAYQKLDRLDEALADFTRAVDLNPSYTLALDNRGELYRSQRKYRQAQTDLSGALELDPNLTSAHYHMGLLRRDLGKWQEALDAFGRALALKPDMAEAYNARGMVHRQRENFGQAIADFTDAVRCRPGYAEAHNNRGIARRLSGDLLLAYNDNTRAIELDESYTLAYINRGITLLALKQPREALHDCDRAIKLDARSALAYNHRGLAHRALEEIRLALEDFDRAIELDQDYAEAYNNRGIARAGLGHYDEAIGDLTRALKLSESADIYLNRGNVYLDQANFMEAADDYERAISLRYEFPQAHLNRGHAFLGLDRLEDALNSFKKAAEFDPASALAFYYAAQTAARLARPDEALAALETAVALEAAYAAAAKKDKAFESLAALPRFQAALNPPQAAPAPPA